VPGRIAAAVVPGNAAVSSLMDAAGFQVPAGNGNGNSNGNSGALAPMTPQE